MPNPEPIQQRGNWSRIRLLFLQERRVMSKANLTTDHKKIRHWAEERGAHPATVAASAKKHEPGILRFDFEPKDEALEEVSWEEFFEKFDSENLALLYQDKTQDGSISRFHKFVERETPNRKKAD